MSRAHATWLLLILTIPWCAACGGGGDDDPVTLVLASIAALDGQVSQSGTVNSGLGFGTAGDDSANAEVRAFYAFDLSAIPAGSVIELALLDTDQITTGTPVASLGPALLDLVDIGLGLASADFDSLPIQSAFASISTSDADGSRQVDVTQQVRDVLTAAGTRFDLRVRFAVPTDNDNGIDFVRYRTGEASLPTLLTVTYRP